MSARSSLLLVLLGAGSLAHGEGRPVYGGNAQAALSAAPTAVDPLSPSLADQELAALVFDAPFTVDDAGNPRPLLAVSLDPPPPAPALGPQKARLKLRPDVKFHDGTPLRAADVAASLERALKDPAGWMLAPIRSVRAVGDDTVELELSRPAPDLALLLSTPAAMVTPGGAARAVGSGPFAVDTFSPSEVHLAANATCFAGRPFLDAVSLRVFASRLEEAQSFEAGALDLARHAGGGLPNAARRPSATSDGPQTLTGYVALGRTISDELVAPMKAALVAGLDRERLRRLVREPARALPAPGADATAPAKLRILVARRTGWHPTLLIDQSRADDKPLAERLLVELSKMGVELTIEAQPAEVYRKRMAARAYELALGTSAPPAPGLGELALLAAVDPPAARAVLARAPAPSSLPELDGAPVVPLFRRAARLVHAPELRGVRVDFAGRASLAETHRRP
jgi:peptide/nickel transport system substrate-binding protein